MGKIMESDLFLSQTEGLIFQILKGGSIFQGKKCRIILRRYNIPNIDIKYRANAEKIPAVVPDRLNIDVYKTI